MFYPVFHKEPQNSDSATYLKVFRVFWKMLYKMIALITWSFSSVLLVNWFTKAASSQAVVIKCTSTADVNLQGSTGQNSAT